MTDSAHPLTALAAIIAQETGVDPETVGLAQTLDGDLDLDWLSRLSVITHAEDEFQVDIPAQTAAGFQTVGDLARFLSGDQPGLDSELPGAQVP